ncbi:hypothetical protein AHV57_24935 [Salmonella enterica]|nr:hypothetical protein [Salmonella enterica]EBA4670969.1 hypothetical protein [Salmonella enterica]EGF6524002.1 hypothetical protein [Salmonella enterica]EHL2771331.1 hypothetical protein [Salmonella enterica subsp. enterica serovar Hvittingfoss]EHL2852182.1 hypothetical protein [Salmonella enterica subsp. enterica serovar Hvittingfoss]
MIFLLNVLFRFLHMLMVLLPSQRVVTPWLRQMVLDVRLMISVATDIRLAGEVLKQTSRNGGEAFPGAELLVEETLYYAAHSLGWGLCHGLSYPWPAWLIQELERRGANIDESGWCEGRSNGFRGAYELRNMVTVDH